MKRVMKKVFSCLLVVSSLVIVYLKDNNSVTSENYLYTEGNANGSSIFNIQNNDVIVLLHIPGTGTTSFSQSLVKDLITDTPCQCPAQKTRCSCKNKNGNQWLFQSYNSTGFVCGEHADWTALTKCPIDQWMENVGHDNRRIRRYWMLAFLREPASRFIQEWHHLITRDAYFRNEPRLFRKESVELQKKELPCLVGKRIAQLTVREFLDCRDNPAVNRMTRMLANLTEVDSFGYHGDEYDTALLKSAMQNLEQLPFFGISEKPKETQILLEVTLGLRFTQSLNFLPTEHYKPISEFELPANLVRSVRLANHLDVRVYDHALKLFDRQLEEIRNAFPFLENDELDKAKADDKEIDEEFEKDLNDKINSEEEGVDEDSDDEYENNDERHERKMTIDESVLDFSVKDEDENQVDDTIKNSDVEKMNFKMIRDEDGENKLLTKREFDESNDDSVYDIVDELTRSINKRKTGNENEDMDDDYDFEKVGSKKQENDFYFEKEIDTDDNSNNNIIDDKNNRDEMKIKSGDKSEKETKQKMNPINDVNIKVTNTKNDNNDNNNNNKIMLKDDISKTNMAKDTEDVNEFFNLLAESKQAIQQQQKPSESEEQPEKETNNPEGNPNHQNSLEELMPPSLMKRPQRQILRSQPNPFLLRSFQIDHAPQRPSSHGQEDPSSLNVKESEIKFKARLLRNDGVYAGAERPSYLPHPSLLPLGLKRVRNGQRVEHPLRKKINYD